MMLSEDMLNFRPKLKENFILYSREELDGFYTIRFDCPFITSEVLLNNSFVKIFYAFNGENSIRDIIDYIVGEYKGAVKEIVSKDVEHVLQLLMQMQGILWEGENPFIKSFTKEIDSGYKIYLANYSDIDKIDKLLKISDEKSDDPDSKYIRYFNPLIGGEAASRENVMAGFAGEQYSFIVEKDKEIAGFFSFEHSTSTVNCLKLFILDENAGATAKYLKYAISLIPKNKLDKTKCFRAFLLNENSGPLLEGLKQAGFEKSLLLENELGRGIHIKELNYFIKETA